MKKPLLILLTLFVTATLFAQTTKKKAVKTVKKTNVKKAKPVAAIPLTDMYIINDKGETHLESLNKGDKLVYAITANGNTYDFIITLNGYSYENGIDFNYEMTNANNTTGHVMISSGAKSNAKKYVNYFRGGDLVLTDASSVWMSYENFMDMPSNKTQITFDDGAEETFYKLKNNDAIPSIIFKGKKVKIEAFTINNGEDGKGDKALIIQNTSANPLIIKMDIGFTVELKEIK
jgi:hypothetical protein